MRRRGGLGLVVALVVVVGALIALLGLRSSGEAPGAASFGFADWLVRCQSADGKAGCGMSQRILDRASGQPVLQLHLARAASGEKHQLVLVLPLGVTVANGAALQIGEVKRNVPFTQCLPGGCVAPLDADSALIEQMKSAQGGRVAVVDRMGKAVAIPFSLNGFAPAFEKMESGGGIADGGATWWTNFWNWIGTN
jgi:invasion protein IalB